MKVSYAVEGVKGTLKLLTCLLLSAHEDWSTEWVTRLS